MVGRKARDSMETQEYAKSLYDRFNSMREAVKEERLRPIFSGAKQAVAEGSMEPETKAEMLKAYEMAEKQLFGTTSQPSPA
jgi:hypothetical protein